MEQNINEDPQETISNITSVNTDNEILTEEDIRFGSKPPFATLMTLALGPLLSRTSAAFQDAIDLFIIKKGYGSRGIGVVALSAMVRNTIISFSMFMTTALMVQVSALAGQKRTSEAAQLVVDALRISILVGILMPTLTYFLRRYILQFLSCPDEYIDDSSKYVFCASTLSLFSSAFNVMCGALLGLGKSTYAGVLQIIAIAFPLCIVNPILCFAVKAPLWSLGFSYVSGQSVLSIVLFVLFFMGKYSIKPTFRMFLEKPSEFLGTTIGKSAQYVIFIFAQVIPPFFLLKFLINAAEAAGIPATTASQIFTTFIHPYSIIGTLASGFMAGFPSSAAYAYNAKLYKRVFQLLFNSQIVPVSIMSVLIIIVLAIPDKVQSIWIDDESILVYSHNIRPPFYTEIIYSLFEALNSLLIATGHSFLGALPNAVLFMSRLGAVFIIHYTYKTNPWALFYSVPISDVCSLLTAILGAITPIKFMRKQIKEKNENERYLISKSLL
jgi:Na+-driven multidrug efflux pump